MTRGPGSVWRSVQMSPAEADVLDEAVEREKQQNPLMTRNKFIRQWIKSLQKG